MNHKKAQLSCILYIPVSHITYHNIWDHVSHVSISPHHPPPLWTLVIPLEVEASVPWPRWNWCTGPRGVGVPLCPGLLASSWVATIHQDRASRTRAATGVRLGCLNWYNAAVDDDVRCTLHRRFYVSLSYLLVKQFTGFQSVNLQGSKQESNMVAITDACPSAPFNQANWQSPATLNSYFMEKLMHKKISKTEDYYYKRNITKRILNPSPNPTSLPADQSK